MSKRKTKKKTKAKRPAPPPPPRQKRASPNAAGRSPFADDPRLPKPGSTISVERGGKTYECVFTGDGFTYEGETYRSLSAVASKILGGQAVNGFLWWGLIKRESKPRAPKAEKPARAKKAKPAASPRSRKGRPAKAAVPENDLATDEGQRKALADAGIGAPAKKPRARKAKVVTTEEGCPSQEEIAEESASHREQDVAADAEVSQEEEEQARTRNDGGSDAAID